MKANPFTKTTQYLLNAMSHCRYYILAVVLFLSGLNELQATQLNGNYTIDPAGTASATVFKNLSSVVTYMTGTGVRSDGGPSNASPFGVSGAVVFNVAAGTYTGQLDIPAITGASVANSITFDGGTGNASLCIVTAAGTASLPYTIRLNNASYISFKNLTIRGTFTNAWPVHFFGNTACNNDTIKNCVIDFGSTPIANFSSTNYIGIVFSGNASSYSTNGNYSNNCIDSNTIMGGYSNISVYANNTASNGGNAFTGNSCLNAYQNGIYLTGINGGIIDRNTITMNANSATSTGLYITAANALAATNTWSVSRNKITNMGQYGIWLYNSSGYSTNRGNLVNNSIGGGFRNANPVGLYLYFYVSINKYWNILHNSINIDNIATIAGSSCIYSYSCCNSSTADNFDFRNNILAVTNPASAATLFEIPNWGYSYSFPNTASFNYNLFYKAGAISTTAVAYNAGTAITLSSLIGNGGYNTNSVIANPGFAGSTNLQPYTPCNNGVAIAAVTIDINGSTRGTPPDFGAYEVIPSANDLGVLSITGPVIPFTAGSNDITVVLKNYGSGTVTSANVNYSVNGGAPVTAAFSGSIAPCSTATFTFTGINQYNFVANTAYAIKAYSTDPNGGTDGNFVNDTTTGSMIYAALSGNFTIDPLLPASSSNFQSFTTAVNALASGGVNGPVTFNVASGTYTQQIIVQAPGASVTNTVTFDGGNGNAATRILTFAGTASNPATIRLNGCANVTFRNLTITTTGASEGWGVNFFNTTNCRLNNCVINVSGPGATSTSSNYQGINICAGTSNSNYSTASTVANNNMVDSCTINAGYFNIYTSISSGALTNYFTYNTLNSAYYSGVYFNSAQTVKFNNNIISLRNAITTNYGLYFVNCNASGAQFHEIRNNRILNAGQYGMYFTSSSGSGSAYGQIHNNFIGGGFRNLGGYYGIWTNTSRYQIWNNSFNMDFSATSGTTAAIYLNGGNLNDIQNNHLIVSGSNAINAIPINSVASSYISVLNNNNYYNRSSSILLSIAGVNYTSANYKAAFPSGGGVNSINLDPSYFSTTNLHTGSPCNNGANLGITSDIDGETRSSTPDIGADEVVSVPNNDIGIFSINYPVFPLSTGSQNINITIKNYGNNVITSANINYRVNGGSIVTQAWTGSVNPCDTLNFTFTTPYTFASGVTNLKVFTTLPNGVADASAANDTAQYTLCPAMSGTYTIGTSGNYTSFAAAASALSCGGVNGPVTFLVSPGTYSGQFMLTPVNGASVTNTITFRSATNNASDVVLSYSSTVPADNYIVTLNGCSYITFDNITFAPSGVNYGNAVVIANGANYNMLDSCIFNGLSTTSATSNLALIYSSGTKDNYNIISNSTFNNAAMGINWISNSSSYATGNQFLKNTFNNQYYCGIYTQYHDYLRIKQNIINASTSYTGYYGIYQQYTYNITGASEITKNKVIATIGSGSGIYNYYGNNSGNSTNRFLIANNMVQVNVTSTNQSYGINNQYSYYIDVLHNTVNISAKPTGTSYAYYDYWFYSTGCFVQNNVFVNSTVGATGTSYAVFEQLNNAGTWNNNNYYSTGTNLGSWNGAAKSTLALWQAAGSQDAASFNKYPVFASSSDLHFYNLPCLNNAGANVLTKVADDFDGTARTITPDLGAAEFSPVSLDASVIAVRAPSGALTVSSPYNVVVTVSNLGTSVINSLVVGYRVNGGTAVTQSLSSLTLNPCDTLQVTFNATSGPGSTDQRYVALAGLVGVQTFTSVPNAGTDLNAANDTFAVAFCTPFSGTFTIDGSLPASSSNFQSFTAAKSALTGCGGITGPVVFNVAAGTYNEQIDLTAITGASATNTITFDGGTGNATTRILNNASTASNSLHTLRISSANYISIRNITIRCSNGAYGWPLHILGSSSNLKIKNCVIDFVGSGMNATNDNFDGIVVNNYAASASPSSGTWTGTNIEIDSNRILGGNNSIYVYGNNANTGVYIRSNRADSAYTYGMYVYNLPLMKINYNTISMSNSGSINSYGIYINTCNASATNFHEVNGNKIINCGYFGIYLNGSNGQASIRSQMFNNAIGGGFRNSNPSGIYFSSNSYNWDVWHNSVNLDNLATGGSSGAIYVGQCCTTGSTLLDIRNNVFAVTTTGSTSYPIYFSNGGNYAVSSTSTLNYNLYYKAGVSGSQPFLYSGGIQTLANFINNGGYNANSYSANPGFTNSRNLQSYNACNKGTTIAAVTTDINGTTRNVIPNAGAYEVSQPALDLGADNITFPVAPFNAGPQNITVVLKNYGSSTITSANVNYSVNGGTPVTATFAGSILPCSTATFTFSGVNQYNFAAGSTYSLKVWTSGPNSGTDAVNVNDTANIPSIGSALSGTYTIDPASPSSATNFQSFTAAATALNSSGVNGPVIINVASGTYTEQFNLQVLGTSAINTITIQSASLNASAVTLQYNSTLAGSNYVVNLNGTSYTTIKYLTLTALNATNGNVLTVNNGASYNTFQNNILNGISTTSTSTALNVIYFNGTGPAAESYNTIANNIINNGSYGVSVSNNSVQLYGNVIQNNTITNPYSGGIYCAGTTQYNLTINANIITTNLPYTNFYGIQMSNIGTSGGNNIITNNRITGAQGGYGIYCQSVYANSPNYVLLAGNTIQLGAGSNTAYGLYLSSFYNNRVYNNTVNITSGLSTGYALYWSSATTQVTEVKYNIFANTGNGAAAGYAVYCNTNLTTVLKLDSNDYYVGTGAAGLGNYNAAPQATLAAWKTAMVAPQDVNSINVNPNFVSASDLHINSSANLITMAPNTLVPVDMDNTTRCGFTDIGAYHHPANNNIGVSSIAYPYGGVAGAGTRDVQVYIRNYGGNTVTSANVRYTDNTITRTVAWTGTLNTCDSVLVTFTGANQYTFSGPWSLKFYTDGPNGNADSYLLNDTIQGGGCTGMVGAFTIDPTGSGTTNYTTFALALAAMQSCGIGGPVTFNVAAATYNEQISIPNISGTSATNTITFEGGNGNASTRILTFPTTNSLPYVVRFNACKYVVFRNITIRSTGATDAWVAHFLNGNDNKINNCVVEITGAGAISTASNLATVVVNGHATTMGTTSTLSNNNSIDSCTLNAGYYNVYASINLSPNTLIVNATSFNSAYQYGFYGVNPFSLRLRSNTINLRTTIVSNQPVYLQSVSNTGTDYLEISGNRIVNPGTYGIYLNSCSNSGSATNQIFNNMIGGNFRNAASSFGIYLTSCTKYNIYHNSINFDIASTSGTNAAIYIQNGGTNDVRNNHFVISNPAAIGAYPIYISPATAVTTCDNNNYYNRSGTALLNVNGVTFNAANFRAGYPAGGGLSSINIDPSFISAGNLHVTAPCNNGVNLGLATDIDGEVRTPTPDIGADEVVSLPNNDLGVYSINSPVFPLSTGSQSIIVTFKNYGNNIVTSANLNYSINGGSIVTQAWTGTINPCATTDVTFTTPYNFTSGSNNIRVFTSLPNGVGDANMANDTAQNTLCPAMNGTYTIGATGNYPTFTAALNALNCGGVNGPVTFVVSPGTYPERINLLPITGSSAVNTITFRSATNNATDVVMSYTSASAADNFIVTLNGCSYVTFDNITFSPSGINYGNAVVITNGANFNTIDSCIFNGLNTSSSTSNLALIFSNNTKDNNNTISNNTFNNGSYGIYWNSNTSLYAAGNQILKNTFNNQYSCAIYTYYHDYIRIKQNTINASTSYTGYYGIYCQFTFNTSGASEITKNKIMANIGGGYGIYSYYSNFGGNSTNRFLLANNMVQVYVTSTSTGYGIYNQYAYYIDVMHNTVNLSAQPAGTSYAYYNANFNSPTCFVQNNVFVNSTVGAAAISYAAYESVSNAGTWNNNNYYSTGTNLGSWNSVAKTTLALWQAAGSQDAASFNKRPVFVSSSDLHFYNLPCLNNAGANVLTKVADDFDGNARTSTPDIGAAEYTPATLDASVIAMRAPSGSLTAATPYNVVVTLANMGTTVISSVVVGYRVNGGTAVTQTLSSLTLNPCDTLQVTFNSTSGPGSTDQRYVALAGLAGVQAFTATPNSGTDLNSANDTLSTNFCTPFSGTFTIDGSLPASATNFTSFTAAKNALTSCGGVTGPVVFNVAAGTYNEQIDITAITGVSASNTITFDGGTGNASTRILYYSAAASNSLHTMRLNNVQYIYLRNLTIRGSSGGFGWPLHIYGSSSNIKVKNCVIDFAGNGLNAINDNFNAIVVNNYAAAASPTSGNWTGTNIEIDSNRILGGNASIYIYGNGANTGVYFRNNNADSANLYGIYAYNLPLVKLSNNTISMITSGSINSYGIYFNSCNASATNYHEISGNKLINCGLYGIYMNSSNGQATPRSQMFNNAIGGGFRNSNPSGIYFGGSYSFNWDVWHNSVNLDNVATGTSSAGIYLSHCCTTGSTLLDIRNNLLAVSAVGSSSYPIYFSNSPSYGVIGTASLDYNLYYKAGITTSQPFIYIQSAQTMSNYINNGGYNANSFSAVPGFISSTNLQIQNACTRGTNIAAITTDINGVTRGALPNAGAYEVSQPALDLGVESISGPLAPFSTGPQSIIVRLRNFGSSAITSANVSYSVNGGTPVTIPFTGSLAPCSSVADTFDGANQFNFIAGTIYSLKVWTSVPNGGSDANASNDTSMVPLIGAALSGIYTINPASPASATNFQSFTTAASALNTCGVNGPVTINVSNGTYTEQFNLQVSGVSVTNTLTIQSAALNSGAVILQYNATSALGNYTVNLNGTSYATFRYLTLNALNTTNGTVLTLNNSASYNTFQNCIFNSVSTTNNSTALSVINFNGTGSGAENYNSFIGNTINNGSYGVIIFSPNGGTGNIVQNNLFYNQYAYGIQSSGNTQYNLTINANTISTNSTYTNYYGINLQSVTTNAGNSLITKNKITGAFGGYGIYCNSVYSNAPNYVLIANNIIQIGAASNTAYGMYLSNVSGNKIFNNTVNVTSGQVNGYGLYWSGSSTPLTEVKYNIFVNSGNGTTSGYAVYSNTNNATYLQIDSNDYFVGTGGANLANYNGTPQATLTAWKTAMSTLDANSINVNPGFVSSSDLHLTAAGSFKGTPLSILTDDVDGEPRHALPDIGADEYYAPLSNNIISATQTICSGATPSPLTGSLPAGGIGVYTYSWLSSTTSATAGFALASDTNNLQNYSPSSLTAKTWYRRLVSSSGRFDTSAAITINVNLPIASNTISGSQTVCSGTAPSVLSGSTPTGGDGSTYTYSWLSSTTSATTGFAVAGGTNNTQLYSPASLSVPTWFRRMATSGVCSSDTSGAVLISINPAIAGNTISGAQTLCSGNTPSTITGATPTGGNGSYTYTWLSSNTGATTGFTVAGGTNNGVNYSPASLTSTRWYRRLVTSGGGCSDTSAAIQITVNPVIASNTASGTQTICSGSTPSVITGSTPTGGSGTYTYSWLSSNTSATAGFAVASGTNNTVNYAPGTLLLSTWYRRLVTSGGCTDTSAAAAVTVTPSIAGNTIGSNQSILINTTPSPLTGSLPTGGTGTYTYSWLSSTTSGTAGFSAIASTNTQGYAPGSLAVTTWYRRLVISGSCSDTSSSVAVSVNANLANNTISAPQTICSGSTPAGLTGLVPVGGTGTYVYTWLSSTTSATAGFAAASGTNNTQNYSPGALTQTTWYRRYVTSLPATDTSTAIAVTVTNAVSGNTASGVQTICSGSTPSSITGSTPTGGNGTTYTYRWVKSTTSATAGFANAGGNDSTQSYQPGSLTATTWYRRAVTSGACSTDTTTAVQVTVNPVLASNTATGTQTICTGSTPSSITGSTPTGGGGTYTYTWLSSTVSASTGFAAAAGTNNTANYQPSSLTTTTWYRRYVTSGGCADTSASVLVTVNPIIVSNTATGTQTICSGSTPTSITGSTPTGGSGTYTYSWLSSTTSATTGFAVAGGTNNTINYAPGTLSLSTWYRRLASSGGCTDTSAAAAVTVNTAVANNTATGTQTICSGSAPSTITGSTPTGGNGSTYTYSWLSSISGATSGFALAGGTNNVISYTPSSLATTTWFRRRVTSGVCASDTSVAVQVTVTNAIANNTATGAQTICNGNAPSLLTGSTPTGGNGSTYNYRWIKSTTSATAGYANAGLNDSAISYTSSALTASTWFRRVVTSGVCATDTSAAVLVTVNNTNTWTGTTSTAWATVTNWGCGRVPVSTDSVVIVTATNQPIVIDGGRVSNSLTIATGASLTINNAASQLTIGGVYTNSGTLTHSAGEIVFGGTFNQNIPAGTYNKVTVNNAAGVTLTGNATLNDSLKLTNGSVYLGKYKLTLGGTTGIVHNASASKYIVTNDTGSLIIQNIGSAGRSGTVVFPVGTSTSYTPVTISNSTTLDQYYVRVADSISEGGYGPIFRTNNAVNKRWLIASGNGNTATLSFQWNASDELPGFTRSVSYISKYTGIIAGPWASAAYGSPSGTNPYVKTAISGIVQYNYPLGGLFGIGSNGALPVELVSFTGSRRSDNVDLKWTTASEMNNDHFVIERSTDAVNFTYAGTVKGQGTSSMMNNYNLTDNVSMLMSQKIPMVYYRLTQVDINGATSEGGIVAVNIANILSGITVNAEPNPFNTNVTVRINIAEEENITIQLTDMTGRLITEQITNAKAGDNSVEMTNIDHLKDGMYLINVISKQGTVTHKVIKQN